MTAFTKFAFAFLGLALASLTPALAQQPSAAAIAAAKEIMLLKNAPSLYNGAIIGLVEQAKDTFLQSNLDKQKDLNEVAVKVMQDLNGRQNEIGDEMARLYAKDFTDQEMKDLLAFYRSPLGRKLIDKEPQAMAETMNYINVWSQKYSDDIVVRFKAEMKKRGKDI